MRKSLLIIVSAVLMLAVLGGCGMANKNVRTKNLTHDGYTLKDRRFANDQRNEMNYINGVQQNGNNLIGNHKNYRMEMSKEIADRIVKIEGIKSSHVVLTDNNAYVAVSFEDDHVKGDQKLMSRTNVAQMGTDAVDMHRRMNTTATGHDKLTADLKNKVSNAVKEMRPQTGHVYVSANPDFVGRMKGYATDFSLGHPIQGFITEFNAMVDRVFPTVHGDNVTHSRGLSDRGGRILE